MKTKIIISLLLLVLFTSCDKGSEVYTTHNIWAGGFKALTPSSDKKKCSVKFLFFSTEGNPKFNTPSKRANSVLEFIHSNDQTYNMLKNEDMISLENGEKVKAIKSVYVIWNYEKYETITLPIGQYFVCAVSIDDGYESQKYSTKTIEVKERQSELILNPVFPCDYTRYGAIPWTQWAESFTYTWDV